MVGHSPTSAGTKRCHRTGSRIVRGSRGRATRTSSGSAHPNPTSRSKPHPSTETSWPAIPVVSDGRAAAMTPASATPRDAASEQRHPRARDGRPIRRRPRRRALLPRWFRGGHRCAAAGRARRPAGGHEPGGERHSRGRSERLDRRRRRWPSAPVFVRGDLGHEAPTPRTRVDRSDRSADHNADPHRNLGFRRLRRRWRGRRPRPPGAIEYQGLHSDNVWVEPFDPVGGLTSREMPVPVVTINFAMVDLTWENGPIRQIPGTQRSTDPIPTLADEPDWMKWSTLCPVPAGSAVFRDNRTWHGGTPNLSDHVRALPQHRVLRTLVPQRGHQPMYAPRAVARTLAPRKTDLPVRHLRTRRGRRRRRLHPSP